jgi:hypothetical protein
MCCDGKAKRSGSNDRYRQIRQTTHAHVQSLFSAQNAPSEEGLGAATKPRGGVFRIGGDARVSYGNCVSGADTFGLPPQGRHLGERRHQDQYRNALIAGMKSISGGVRLSPAIMSSAVRQKRA